MDNGFPVVNIEELKEKIRAEVKQRRENRKPSYGATFPTNCKPLSDFHTKMNSSAIPSESKAEVLEFKERYHINDFLKFRDRHFLIAAYRGILKRSPDSSGLGHFLDKLRSGKMTKAEILGRLRYAPEGRAKKTKVAGLFWNFVFQSSFRIPILGYFFRLVTGIGNLPLIIHNMEVLEERATAKLESQQNDLAMLQTRTDEIIKAVKQWEPIIHGKADLGALAILKEEVNTALEKKTDRPALAALKEEVDAALENKVNHKEIQNITDQIHEILRQTRDHKLHILDQQRRLMFLLEEARKRFPDPISTDQIEAMLTEEDHILDAMYVSLEDRFRGTREDIKQKQRIYLPYLKGAGNKGENLPVLDMGCGRGEWLELLKAEGLEAQGVDINHVLVKECIERGLNVVQSDFVSFLREVPDNSVRAVTAFHLIEHVPLKLLITLLDEAFRVIAPGGCVILETPNPENLIVGACNFYVDPTHKNPLHPEFTKFIVESRGFVPVFLDRLNPIGQDYTLNENGTEIVKKFNQLFYGPQDYAAIGVKP